MSLLMKICAQRKVGSHLRVTYVSRSRRSQGSSSVKWGDCATEQHFPVVLFFMQFKVALTLSLWMKSYGVTIQMKAAEQYFPVVLFIMLYKVVLTFESVDEILSSDHLIELLSSSFMWYCLFCQTNSVDF